MSHRDVPIPERLRKRPVDKRGFVITYVTLVDDKTREPDFRIIDHVKVVRCINNRLCGLCGEKIGHFCAFIGGNESVEHRMFSDPPMHLECARYATKVCPFLAHTNVQHTPHEELQGSHADVQLIENPLAGMERPQRMAIYVTKTYQPLLVAAGPGQPPTPAMRAGKPVRIEWF